MRNKKRICRKIFASVLAFAVAAVLAAPAPAVPVQAAAKKTVKGMTVSVDSVTLEEGKSRVVKVTVKSTKKSAAKDLMVKAKSSNKKTAAVKITKKPSKKAKSGVSTLQITAKGAGTAKITVTAKNKNKKGKVFQKVINVTVKEAAGTPQGSTPTRDSTPTPDPAPDPTPIPNPTPVPTPDPTPTPDQTPIPAPDPALNPAWAVGKYQGYQIQGMDLGGINDSDFWYSFDEIYDNGESYIELKADGTADVRMNGEEVMPFTWTLRKEALQLRFVGMSEDSDEFEESMSVIHATLTDDMITAKKTWIFSTTATFKKQ